MQTGPDDVSLAGGASGAAWRDVRGRPGNVHIASGWPGWIIIFGHNRRVVMERRSQMIVGAGLGLVFGLSAAHAEIYRCADDKGAAVFQDKPCVGQGSKVTVRPAAGVPSREAVERAKDRVQSDAARLLLEGQVRRAIAARRVIAGMSPNEVREAVGAPAAISPKIGQLVPTEAWVYSQAADGSGVTGHIILRSGTVTDVALTPYEPPRAASREAQRSADTQSRASERRFIEGKALSESELLARIGEPDRREMRRAVCVLPYSGRTYSCEQLVWIYDPAPGDPQTRTTVTMGEGYAGRVEREIAR